MVINFVVYSLALRLGRHLPVGVVPLLEVDLLLIRFTGAGLRLWSGYTIKTSFNNMLDEEALIY